MHNFLSNADLLNQIDPLILNNVKKFDIDNKLEIKRILQNIICINSGDLTEISNDLINFVGSNHGGFYYVDYFWVVDFLIEILERGSENCQARSKCILAILNNLHYFEPEIKFNVSPSDSKKMKEYATARLSPYSDELFDELQKKFVTQE